MPGARSSRYGLCCAAGHAVRSLRRCQSRAWSPSRPVVVFGLKFFFASHKQRQDQLETGPGLAEADEAEAERS